MVISAIGPSIFSIELDGIRQLGIAIGPSKNSMVGTLNKFKDGTGLLIPADGNTVRQWNVAGFVAHNETLLAYGPWLAGPVSYAGIFDLSSGESLQRLVMLSRVVEVLDRDHRLPPQGLNLDGFIHCEDESILVLPPGLQELIRGGKNIEQRFLPYDSLHHPSLKGSASWAFSLAVLAFRLKCGIFPFESGADSEEWTSRMISRALETPRCRFPGAPQALENAYTDFFVRHEFTPDVLSFLPAILSLWLEIGDVESVSPLASADFKNTVTPERKSFLKRVKRYKRRRFIRYNRLWIGVSATVALVAAIIVASIVGQYFRTPLTAGMSANQVLESFYTSFNTLDATMMEDATRNNAAQSEIGLISNLNIIARVRSASENRKVHFTPEEWARSGKPGTEYSLMVFGIDELHISMDPPESAVDRVHAAADYKLYSNISDQEENDQTTPVLPKIIRIYKKHDEVLLTKNTRGLWAIDSIKQTSTP